MLSEDISGQDEEHQIEYDFKLISCHLIIARLRGWKLYTRNCAQAVTMIRKSLRRPAVGSLFKSSLLPMKCLQSHSAQLFHWQWTFCCYNTPSCFWGWHCCYNTLWSEVWKQQAELRYDRTSVSCFTGLDYYILAMQRRRWSCWNGSSSEREMIRVSVALFEMSPATLSRAFIGISLLLIVL